MASLRFLASLFALIAIVALVADATPALSGTGPFTAHASSAIGRSWRQPRCWRRARSLGLTFPWVWNPVILSVLSAPMSMLFGGLAVVCGYFGRRRAQLKVHIN